MGVDLYPTRLRVWWIPAVGRIEKPFYVPVNTPEEGKSILNILAAYDIFLEDKHLVPEEANDGGLEMLGETGEWVQWESEDGYDDLDEYIEECSPQAEAIEKIAKYIFFQP